jgi:hypothetical protein
MGVSVCQSLEQGLAASQLRNSSGLAFTNPSGDDRVDWHSLTPSGDDRENYPLSSHKVTKRLYLDKSSNLDLTEIHSLYSMSPSEFVRLRTTV